jgi:CCR4-NOT transcription complex subunit 4
MELTFDAMSGNHLLDPSSSLRNPYQVPTKENISGDLEFMDPAILAVGKGRLPPGLNSAAGLETRPNYASQLNAVGNEASLQLLMQRSLPPLQNQRLSDMGNGFSPLSDAYRFPSRIMEQTQTNNLSPFSQHSLQQSRTAPMLNGQWGWNEVQTGNDVGMAELLRTEVLGLNKFYAGYEDSRFRMPSSGDLYNRPYGI